MPDRLLLLWHFVRTRWFPGPPSRRALERHQKARLRAFLDRLRRQPAFRERAEALEDWPVMDKGRLRAAFQRFNPAGITLAEAEAVALEAESTRDFRRVLPGGLTVGLSSGTSGYRQVFLVSRRERLQWAGQMLARMLSGRSLRRLLNPFAPPLRVAFFLRADSNLYATLRSRRMVMDHHDLTRPFEALVADLEARPPHILVAPASVLGALARRRPEGLRPWQVVSVAETLDDRERALVEAAFGQPVAQVYQAAEGCLGSSCREGRIHLHETDLHIEPDWVGSGRFRPLVTDFSREAQWFVRHRLEDLLVPHPDPCPCGAPTLSLRAVEGRSDEVLWLADRSGVFLPVFPDAIRQVLYSLPDPPDHYRILQRGPDWEVQADPPERAYAAALALQALASRQGLRVPSVRLAPWEPDLPGMKTRRIRCLERPGGGA